MILRSNRFHGHGSLRYLYTRGKTVRSNQLSLRYITNGRRNTWRMAVVVSKKSIPLKRILEIKNNLSFDAITGAVSSTFFPINIFILPFMPLIVLVKNKNTNETFNKF